LPVVVAQRSGPCAACGARIPKGERIEYTTAAGARHLACSDMDSTSARKNQHVRPCALCDVTLAPGKGRLEGTRVERDGVWSTVWRAVCVDVLGCDERIRS